MKKGVIMIVLQTDKNSKIFEVDSSMFEEVKEFLKKISKKNKKNFSYIDDLGDKIVVINGKEDVIPTREDLEAIYNLDRKEFVDEEEAKRLLDV